MVTSPSTADMLHCVNAPFPSVGNREEPKAGNRSWTVSQYRDPRRNVTCVLVLARAVDEKYVALSAQANHLEEPMALELCQRTGLVSQISIALRDKGLEIEKRRGLKTIRKELPLTSVSPEIVHTRVVSIRWIAACLGAATLALAGVFAAFVYPTASSVILLAVACALATLVCGANAYNAYRGRYACREAATGAEVISINATPDGKSFAKSLRDAIESVQHDVSLSAVRRAEQHKKHVEFLLAEGVLTPTEFSSIMSRMERKISLERLGRLRA